MIAVRTKFGTIRCRVSATGLVRLQIAGDRCSESANSPRTRIERWVARELREYCAGRRRRFTFPVDLQGRTDFQCRVLRACFAIPYGTVVSYKDLARLAGFPRAVRAVGQVMARNPVPIVIPCHRIVSRSGALRGYRGGLELKKVLLEHEGAAVR